MKSTWHISLAVVGFSIIIASVLAGCSSKDSSKPDVDVSELISALKSEDKDVRVDAAVTLASAGGKAATAVPTLIESLKDQSPEVRRLAAYALGEIGPKASQAIPALKELLRDENRELVTQVVNSLKNIDPKSIQGQNVNVMSGNP
jgi:HEAT repeat protein